MDTGDYGDAVRRILTTASRETSDRLERFFAAARAGDVDVEGIAIDVFVDQDGEGPFDVWARSTSGPVSTGATPSYSIAASMRNGGFSGWNGVNSAGSLRCRRGRAGGRATTSRRRSSRSWRGGWNR